MKRIYFYCAPQGPPEAAAYQHTIVSIAEGLKELGIEFYSDKNYWKISAEDNKYLFNHNPKIGPNDCDVVVFNDVWFTYGLKIPKNLFGSERKYLTVYVDSADGLYTQSYKKEFRKFDIVLKAQFNKKLNYPDNVFPWAYGLSNRIIESTQAGLIYDKRIKKALSNPRIPQQIRELAQKTFIPLFSEIFPVDNTADKFSMKTGNSYEKMLWEQTGRRHYSSYYKKLKENAFCCCFAGMFIFPLSGNLNDSLFRLLNMWNLNTVKYGLKTDTIIQFDGWRFWETLSSGCIAINADFKKYGAVLPVMPENFRHYIGVDFDNVGKSCRWIKENSEQLPIISREGQKWVLENYSPKAVARRFLRQISDYQMKSMR